jgi:pimeloyl-ACP methyl ester carboxylesterase
MFDYDWRRDALEQSVQLERQVERLHAQVHRFYRACARVHALTCWCARVCVAASVHSGRVSAGSAHARAAFFLQFGPVQVVGHSLGCLLTASVMHRRPELFHSVLFAAPPYRATPNFAEDMLHGDSKQRRTPHGPCLRYRCSTCPRCIAAPQHAACTPSMHCARNVLHACMHAWQRDRQARPACLRPHQ